LHVENKKVSDAPVRIRSGSLIDRIEREAGLFQNQSGWGR
jgi:hypothetical protein